MTIFLTQTTQPHNTTPDGTTPPPAAAPAAPADQPGRAVDVDFTQLSKDMEADSDTDPPDTPVEVGAPGDSPAPIPPAVVVPPVVPPAAVPSPAVPPSLPGETPSAKPTVPPVAPPTAPVVPPAPPTAAPAAPPAPTPGAPETLTPEKVEAAYKQFEANMLPQLEQQYQLSPELAKQIEEDPAKAIPKLAAQIHYRAQVGAYTGIMSQVPRILTQLLEHSKAADRAEGDFSKRWPLLADSKYSAQVGQGLDTWRKANPSMSTADMIEKAGLWLMVSLGLNPGVVADATPPPVLPKPSVPAGVGSPGSAGRVPPGGATNIFETMAEQMLEEERT